MKWLHVATMVVLSSVVLAGCGPSNVGGDDDDTGGDGGQSGPGLRIAPADKEVSVSGGVAQTIDYKVLLVKQDGSSTDVTSEATLSVDNNVLGSFTGARFTTSTMYGGRTTVRATARGAAGETSLTIRMQTIVIAPGAPADAPARFTGPTGGSAPTLVYPPDATMVPPNLNVMEFHYMPGAGNGLFELVFQGATIELKAYFTCTTLGTGCAFTPDAATWSALALAEKGGQPMRYTLRAVPAGAAPGAPVGASTAQTLSFGPQDIVGGLYYWNSAGSIKRYEFGVRTQNAETFMDAQRAGATQCVGCHTLSRDGKKIAVGLDIPSPAPFKVFDVATRQMIFSKGSMFGGGANFFSFSPDGSQLLSSNGISTVLSDSSTGNPISDPLIAAGTMPDWSPNGDKIVYAKSGMPVPCFGTFCGAPGIDKGSIELYDKSGGSWAAGATLVGYGGGFSNFYPSFSPDARWVVFNRSPSEMNSFDAMDAQVWAVSATGGNPVHLTSASSGGDSWPKWAPDVQPYRGGNLMWFTFSSRRAYGLRLAANTQAQIWMAAFDPSRPNDPSMPAFWLPFQELASGNHIAQWVTVVERQMCTLDGQCAQGEFCQGGRCRPRID